MSKFKKCITNQNDIYLYFEIIKQVQPQSVLDVGMFLKRIGAVSRQAANSEVGSEVCLYGVDFMESCKAEVYGQVYDVIEDVSEFMKKVKEGWDGKFDLAWMLRVADSGIDDNSEKILWKWLSEHADYVVVDKEGFRRNMWIISRYGFKSLQLDDDAYAIVIFNDKEFSVKNP